MLDDAVPKLTGQAIAYISIHPRSEKEIREYIAKKGRKLKITDSEALETVFGRLQELGLTDDRKYASLFIESRLRNHPRGPKVLIQELRGKGIPEDIIFEVCETFFPKNTGQTEEIAVARKIVQKKYSSWEKLPRMEFKKKIYTLLARRGFSFTVINRLIDEYI